MARQANTPVSFERSSRIDTAAIMSSGRAGKVIPVTYIPLLRGDSASGRVGIDVELAEMPRPLLNGVIANVQAWFVPKTAHPQFSGYDEFMHSYQKEPIHALGQTDRTPPPFYNVLTGAARETYKDSEFAKTLGLHVPLASGTPCNTDLVDAFNLIYNFRLAAHSSRLDRREYASEDLANSTALPRAFWPSGRFSRVVPDYERALVVGALDLDVAAGQIPITGFSTVTMVGAASRSGMIAKRAGTNQAASDAALAVTSTGFEGGIRSGAAQDLYFDPNGVLRVAGSGFTAEMEGQEVSITLADIDKARTTQAFAKLRTAYAGNDATGFDNDDAIVAELMQGFAVPADQFKRPWLLDSKRVGFGMVERHATDAANLDQSVTVGRVSTTLSLNVPATDVGGVIMVTVEVLPERLDERQSDEWVLTTDPDDLPDALRDIQRTEPVDLVLNRRLDVAHTTPSGLYGYEPMNDKWNREATRLGGAYFQATPGDAWTEQRSAIWLPEIVDPAFTNDHFLAPEDFPHDVFSDVEADAFEFVARHNVTIVGLTQIGDVLSENNDDYEAVTGA